jgi:hypothetical protein
MKDAHGIMKMFDDMGHCDHVKRTVRLVDCSQSRVESSRLSASNDRGVQVSAHHRPSCGTRILEKTCVSKTYIKDAAALRPIRQMAILPIQGRALHGQEESG